MEIDRIHATLKDGGAINAEDAVIYAQHHMAKLETRIAELEAALGRADAFLANAEAKLKAIAADCGAYSFEAYKIRDKK